MTQATPTLSQPFTEDSMDLSDGEEDHGHETPLEHGDLDHETLRMHGQWQAAVLIKHSVEIRQWDRRLYTELSMPVQKPLHPAVAAQWEADLHKSFS